MTMMSEKHVHIEGGVKMCLNYLIKTFTNINRKCNIYNLQKIAPFDLIRDVNYFSIAKKV